MIAIAYRLAEARSNIQHLIVPAALAANTIVSCLATKSAPKYIRMNFYVIFTVLLRMCLWMPQFLLLLPLMTFQ